MNKRWFIDGVASLLGALFILYVCYGIGSYVPSIICPPKCEEAKAYERALNRMRECLSRENEHFCIVVYPNGNELLQRNDE